MRVHALMLHDLERTERRTRYRVGFRDDNDSKKSAKKKEKENDFRGCPSIFFLLSITHAPGLASKA
jgi:hypothetical protein